jgi:hypothetical protein
MRNLPFDKNEGLFITTSSEMLLPIDRSPSQHHDSVTVTTLVVKENGESLLNKLPTKATSRPVEQGNTKLPLDHTCISCPLLLFENTLHVRYKNSFQMSAF